MKSLLLFLLIVLPFQLGKHFWPSFSYVLGLKVDYLSPAVYLQDILIIFLIILFVKKFRTTHNNVIARLRSSRGNLKRDCFAFTRNNKANIITLFLLISLVSLNIIFALSPTVSFFHWLRISEYLLLGVVISKNKETVWNYLMKIIPFWITGEFVLGFWQFLKQSTVGGIFKFFGERTFNIVSPGIARADWLGRVFLRPYGTFSHPNSLAGFTLVCLILMTGTLGKSYFRKISYFCGFLLLILCFSRTVWFALFLICFFYLVWRIFIFIKNKKRPDFYYFLALFLSAIMVFLFSRTRFEPASFEKRQLLFDQSIKIIKTNPVFGVGLNNFILSLSSSEVSWQMISFLQPVHNIFLLVGSEVGLVGLGFFVGLLILNTRRLLNCYIVKLLEKPDFTKTTFSTEVAKKAESSGKQDNKITNYPFSGLVEGLVLIALVAIMFTGLFDHYWLTLIQNQLLFVIVLGLSL